MLEVVYLLFHNALFLFLTFLSARILLEKFAESDYHRLALEKLEACPFAMDSLGAPPLKVHNIHLTDRDNRINHHTAQVLCFSKCCVSTKQSCTTEGQSVSSAGSFANLVLVILLNFKLDCYYIGTQAMKFGLTNFFYFYLVATKTADLH